MKDVVGLPDDSGTDLVDFYGKPRTLSRDRIQLLHASKASDLYIMIPGFSTLDVFSFIARSLHDQGYPVIMYEIPGCGGRAEELSRQTIASVVEDLDQTLRTIFASYPYLWNDGRCRPHLVSHSFGSMVSTVYWTGETRCVTPKIEHMLQPAFLKPDSAHRAAIRAAQTAAGYTPNPRVGEHTFVYSIKHYRQKGIASLLQNGRQLATERISSIDHPVRIYYGRHDPLAMPLTPALRRKFRTTAAETWLPQSGHFGMLDHDATSLLDELLP